MTLYVKHAQEIILVFRQCNQVYKEIIKYLFNNLQRKTAEYEELKKNNDFADVVLQRKLDKLMNKNNRLEEELNQIKLLLEGKNNQYNAKQQECEELKNKLQIATEALKSILDEADVLDEFISKEGYLCGFVNIAQQALEQLGSEE